MKFINYDNKVVNLSPTEIVENLSNGTSLQYEMNVAYDKLVETFGKPIKNDGYKTDAEWEVLTTKGIAIIYNYKTGKNYLGNEGEKTEKITDWHIGGHSKSVVYPILQVLELPIPGKL